MSKIELIRDLITNGRSVILAMMIFVLVWKAMEMGINGYIYGLGLGILGLIAGVEVSKIWGRKE